MIPGRRSWKGHEVRQMFASIISTVAQPRRESDNDSEETQIYGNQETN